MTQVLAMRATSPMRRPAAIAIVGASLLVGACRPGAEEPGIPINSGFERPAVEGFGRPWGWRRVLSSGGASFAVDSGVARGGRRSLRLDGGAADGSAIALQSWIEPRFAHGRDVRVAGWVRADALRGTARLVIQTWGGGVLAADTARIDPPATTSGGWSGFEATIPVDSSAHSLILQTELEGRGTVWFDDLSVGMGGRIWESVPAADPPDRATLDWLASHSTAFRTVDASAPGEDDWSDLSAFRAIVGEARIVALGEATHGTSEFFRVKHRLLAYLVERLGFRVFAIEANQLAVEPINEYVRGGPGEPRALMRAMFRVWNTEEMRDLIDWMRAYNAAHPDREVEFIGFDMQDPTLPIDSLTAWLGRVEPDLGDRVSELYAPYREAWRAGPYPRAPDSVRAAWFESASRAYDLVVGSRDRWRIGRGGEAGVGQGPAVGDGAEAKEIERAIRNADLARQAALGALTGEFATRDSAMAENIRRALDRRPPGTRIVVWAHDGHISRAEHEYANYWGGGSMGGRLSRVFGDEYRVFGLLAAGGAYSGSVGNEIIDAELLPAPRGTLEAALHRISERLGSPLLVTDLRNPDDPARQWLRKPRPIRMLGYAAEDIGLATGISVGAQFDGVVFIDSTSPSRVFR